MSRRALLLCAAASTALLAGAAPAPGSYLVARDPAAPTLQVDAKGYAVIGFVERGRQKSVVVWGALNALPPTRGRTQLAFKVDYSGGATSVHKANYVRTIKNVCSKAGYDGPPLPWLVTACKAPDGSYWALQKWQRMLPNLGVDPWKPEQAAWELHVSHWKGPLPQLDVVQNWAYGGRFHQLVGRLTYNGNAVYGFKSTSYGAPLDTWGRNVYLDTFDSAYGPGWRRENSFLAQMPNGRFCYTLLPRNPPPGYPAVGSRLGTGKRYRLTVLGPGVLPIYTVEVADVGDWDPNDPAKVQKENDANALVTSLGFSSTQCHA
jgi:hypothetical protein